MQPPSFCPTSLQLDKTGSLQELDQPASLDQSHIRKAKHSVSLHGVLEVQAVDLRQLHTHITTPAHQVTWHKAP